MIDLRRLRLRQAVIHGAIQMERNLRDLTGGDQRAHGHKAAVTWREIWTKPEIPEQHVGRVLHEARHHRAHLLFHVRGARSASDGFVERQESGDALGSCCDIDAVPL